MFKKATYCSNFLRRYKIKYIKSYVSIASSSRNLNNEEECLEWQQAKSFKDIPGPKPLPFVGNSFRWAPGGEFYNLSPFEIHKKLRTKYGPIVHLKGLPLNPKNAVVIFNPNDIQKMYRAEGAWPERHILDSLIYYRSKLRKDVFKGNIGILLTNGEEWGRARSLVNPILMDPKSTTKYIGVTNDITDELIDIVKQLTVKNKEMPDDFSRLFDKWALETITVIALDERLGSLSENIPENVKLYMTSAMDFFELIEKLDFRPSLWRYFRTKNWRRYVRALDVMLSVNTAKLERTMEKINSGSNDDKNDESVFEKILKINENVALTTALDMLSAGVDTTGRIITAALYFIAKNPEAQEKLRHEALSVLPTKNTPITKDILNKTPYVKAVIKETMRISPISIGTVRKIQQNCVMSGYQIPKGTHVISGQLYVANSEEFVKYSSQFIPERWLRQNKDSEISYKNMHPFITLPFSFGPRTCIGKRLANMELEIGLLKFARNFKMTWPHEDMKFGSETFYGMQGPLKMHLEIL